MFKHRGTCEGLTLQAIQIVGIPLHHLAAFIEVLSVIVNSTDVITFRMSQLPLDSIFGPSIFIEYRAELMSKPMSARKTFVADLTDDKQDGIFADGLRFIVAPWKYKC